MIVLFLLAAVPGRPVTVAAVAGDGGPVRLESADAVDVVWHPGDRRAADLPLVTVRPVAEVRGTIAGEPFVAAAPAHAPAVEPDALLPAAGWRDELAPQDRRRWLGLATLAVLATLGAALLPGRGRGRWAAVGVAAAGTLALWLAMRATPDVRRLAGRVVVERPGGVQVDDWTWLRSPTGGRAVVDAAGPAWPVGRTAAEVASWRPLIHVGPDGRTRAVELTLPPGATAAVLQRRTLASPPMTAAGSPGQSRLRTLVRRLYERPGVAVVAESELEVRLRQGR